MAKTKVYYEVAQGDWYVGVDKRYESKEEAEQVFERCKETAVWASLKKVTVVKHLFKIDVEEVMLDSYDVEEV